LPGVHASLLENCGLSFCELAIEDDVLASGEELGRFWKPRGDVELKHAAATSCSKYPLSCHVRGGHLSGV
jgi:hypothetical protein